MSDLTEQTFYDIVLWMYGAVMESKIEPTETNSTYRQGFDDGYDIAATTAAQVVAERTPTPVSDALAIAVIDLIRECESHSHPNIESYAEEYNPSPGNWGPEDWRARKWNTYLANVKVSIGKVLDLLAKDGVAAIDDECDYRIVADNEARDAVSDIYDRS